MVVLFLSFNGYSQQSNIVRSNNKACKIDEKRSKMQKIICSNEESLSTLNSLAQRVSDIIKDDSPNESSAHNKIKLMFIDLEQSRPEIHRFDVVL